MKKILTALLTIVLCVCLMLALAAPAYAEAAAPANQTTEIISGVFASIVAEYVIPLLKTVLMTVASAVLIFIARVAGKGAAALLNTLFKREVAETAMKFVEQKYKEIHGEDKLNKALEKAEAFLTKYHIPFDAEEMEDLIEAAVAEFNAEYKKGAEQITE